MHHRSHPSTPVLRLADRFVVDRRLLRPGAVIESADVGRPERPAVRVHVLDTRETDALAPTVEAWEIADDAGLPVAGHVQTLRIDGLTCVVLDRLEVGPPRGHAARASALAEAAILVPALAERGVRVDQIAPAAIGVGGDGRLAFAEPPLALAAGGSAGAPSIAEQTRAVLDRVVSGWTDGDCLPGRTAGPDGDTEPLSAFATPRPRRSGPGPRTRPESPPGDREEKLPWLDQDRLREVARGRAVVRGSLGLIILAIVLLALGNRGSGRAVTLAVPGGTQQPAAPMPSVGASPESEAAVAPMTSAGPASATAGTTAAGPASTAAGTAKVAPTARRAGSGSGRYGAGGVHGSGAAIPARHRTRTRRREPAVGAAGARAGAGARPTPRRRGKAPGRLRRRVVARPTRRTGSPLPAPAAPPATPTAPAAGGGDPFGTL